ncbi:hypothetical protein QTG54_003597 [Skeletonema marinoi]|uniref:Uncharacterized protein n=1 Tax=Skeletonema marinoi TaxID=267567 RepID=A0AAD8YG67_9STRA|nr:hypothetical protein QTG54_003597 [Skeletonema marinoi]
MIQHRASSG